MSLEWSGKTAHRHLSKSDFSRETHLFESRRSTQMILIHSNLYPIEAHVLRADLLMQDETEKRLLELN